MKRTTIMADEEVLKEIGRIAYQTGKSKAHIIREALAEYVAEHAAKHEEQAWPSNPLLGLIGLIEDDENNQLPTDLSDGKDEALLREILNEKYESEQQRQVAAGESSLESAR